MKEESKPLQLRKPEERKLRIREKKEKQVNQVHLKMSEYTQNSVSSDMDKKAEDMDNIASTPLFSVNLKTTEDLADLDELMHRDDVLEDQEVTRLTNHSSLSDESRITYTSPWCSSPDSDISDRITPFNQNINEEIKKVCQSFFNLENLETEADDFEDAGSTSSLAIRSDESKKAIFSKNSVSSDMDKEAEDMDDIASTPLFSMNSATTEDLDELMHRDEVLEDQEVTRLRTHSSLSDESRMTYPSPLCSSPDSDISDRITPFDQNINEEIKQVCQSVFNLENLETRAEECGAKVEVRTTNIVSMSSLAIRSSESTVPASCSSSSVKTQQCTEAEKQLQSTEDLSTDSVKMFKDSDAPPQSDLSSSPLGCLASKDRAAKKTLKRVVKTIKSFLPGRSTTVKRIQTQGRNGKRKKSQYKWCFSGRQRNKIQPAPLEHLDETVRSASTYLTLRSTGENKQGALCSQETPSTTSCIAALGADLRSTKIVLLDYVEDKDQTPEDTRKALSSLSFARTITPDNEVKVVWSKCPEDPPLTESTTDEFQEEMSSSLSQQSTDSDEEDEETFSESSVEQSQSDSECHSNNQNDAEETKAKRSNHFSRFFCKIFSKNNQEGKEKKVSAENQTKQPPFWTWLLFCSAWSCCLDE